MGKKTKSKARLDKYYYLAKEHGFRSRAAFKLIQLNKKFHFLESANVLIDLCAAPGGWCQVASKQMPVSSIKIGVDLDTIKPIPGVTTFQADITSEKCRHLIRKEIKHFKADVVLNDGAPNVGGLWSKDSFTQTELVLYAVKLATEFLREGGWFITKVFRSSDYNALIYVMRKLFNKVEATKPLASRSQAAEIFVVCSQYKAPGVIDPKLLDPKYALQQLEEEDEMKSNAVRSIKAIFETKKHRGGYNHDSLYIETSFKDYIECTNPYQFLAETHQIKIKTEDCNRYIKAMKAPVEYQLYFDDLQLLGKKEVQELIIWRNKIKVKINAENRKSEKKAKSDEEEGEKDHQEEMVIENEEEADAKVMENMEKELKQFAKQRKKKLENEKKKQERNQMKSKMAFIDQEENAPVDNDVEFDDNLFDELRKNKVDIEQIEDNDEDDEDGDNGEGKYDEFEMRDLSDMDEDDYINLMNEDIEENKKLFEEEKGTTRRKKKKQKAKEDGITYVTQDQQEDDGLEENDNDEESHSSSDDYQDDDEDNIEIDNENDDNLSINEEKDITIVNPLRKTEKKEKEKEKKLKQAQEQTDLKEQNEEENQSSDTDEEGKSKSKSKNMQSIKIKSKQSTNIISEAKEDQFLNTKTNRKQSESSSSSSGYDTDEKAEIRALAKKMLRKKERVNILTKAYNRYVYNEEDKAPQWFLEEERQHNVPNKPVTKAEILSERAYLKKINDRMPKKILEAKARKKNKLNRRLEKVKKKAEVISNQEEFNEFSKVKQIEKLYKRELARSKEKKKYVIARSFTQKSGKDTRTIKHVDRRLKKDKRAEKAREKRNKKNKRRR